MHLSRLRVFRWARDIHSFMLRVRSNRRGGSRDHRERLNEAGMVDLLGMFRRPPAKPVAPGFARSREDITALGDSMGEMLTNPVRDAPPMARETPLPNLDPPRAEKPKAEKPKPRKTNGAAAAPRLAPRAGFPAGPSG